MALARQYLTLSLVGGRFGVFHKQDSKVFKCGRGRLLSSKVLLPEEYVCKEVGIPVPGGTLAGKLWEPKSSEASSKIPPVICLHGWLDNAGTFDFLLPLMMTPSMRYFCPDFPGHGLTTYCSEWWYDIHLEGMLTAKRVANHFGWDKFSILGHSLGGIVGFLYSAYFPDDVHKLVAIENMRPLPVPFENDIIDMMRSSVYIAFEVEKRMKTPKKTYKYDEILEKFMEGRQNTISREGSIALLKRGASEVETGHFQFSYNLRTTIPGQEGRTPPELSMRLANEVKSPLCFIKADAGNNYDKQEEIEKFLSVFKTNLGDRFETHTVPGTHHVHLNDPHLIAPIALRFLTQD